jgi:hypothetical protein
MKRLIAPISLLFLVALAGCSSTPSSLASSASPGGSAVASAVAPAGSPSGAASQPAPATTSPSSSPTSATVAGGTATDFCGAFKELQALNDAPSTDLASMGAKFQAAAADMRKFAPAEIKAAANTYADVIDNIGKSAAAGSFDQAALQKAIAAGMAGHAKDIATTAVWVGKNCSL